MSISIQKKFKSIKRDFLSDGAKGILDQMAKATDNFKDYTAVKKIRPKFESFFDKIKASKPEAIVGFVTKPKRAKKTRANAARTAAYKRRQPQGGVPKDYKDIEKDARRPAISIKGKRTSKTGKTYYEYRDNRWDKRPKRYPKLEDGGEIDKGNAEMIMSTTKSIKHHANELQKLVSMNTPIKAWVVAKLERAETDLSDVTHYIDGLRNEDHMAKGGYTGEPHRLEK